nr:MAG TPA: hypothetical protein [Caudoviricetes sp.]
MDLILYLIGYQPTLYGIMVCTGNKEEALFIKKHCGGKIKEIGNKYILEYKCPIYKTEISKEVIEEKITDESLLFWYQYTMKFKNRGLGKKSKVFTIHQKLSRITYKYITDRISDVLWCRGIKTYYKRNQISINYIAFEEIRIRAGEIQEGDSYIRK